MKYSKKIYDIDVVVKTAYTFIDRAYIHLDVNDNEYTVDLQSKNDVKQSNFEKEFENELIAQQVRKIVSGRTKNIRELIAARALSSTIIELKEKIDEEDPEYDSKEILRDWFDRK